MSQIHSSNIGNIKKVIPDVGDDVLPNIAGEINLEGGNLLEVTGIAATSTILVDVVGGTDGQVIIGSTAGDPAFADLTSAGGTIVFTAGANTLNLETGGAVATSYLTDDANSAVPALGVLTVAGGTNIASSSAGSTVTITLDGTTDHAVQVGNATGSLTSLGVGTNGQVLVAATADSPAFATLTSTNSTIAFTTGINSLDLEVGPDVARNFLTDDGNTATANLGIIEVDGGIGLETSAAGDTITIDVEDSLQITTGFESWSAAGPYFDDTTLGDFELLVGGTGYINTVPVSWTAPQTVTGMVAGNTYFIYIDSTGTLQKTDTFSDALYTDNIVLFQCLRDSTPVTNNQITVKENHPFEMPVETSLYLHKVVGTVIENYQNGANITLNGTQKIQINGDDVFSDHGLYTDITDSAGVGVTFRQMYTDAAGKWATDTLSDTFTGRYNNAGVPTDLSANRHAVYRLYVSKDSLNTTTPSYFAVLHTAEFVTLGAANTAIANGEIVAATNELFEIEVAQLGYIVYTEAGTEIEEVVIEKATLRQTVSTAGTNIAALVNTNITNFDGVLSAADTNVQAALETLDEFGKNLTDHAVVLGNGNGQPLGVTAVGATNQVLLGNTAADPSWGTVDNAALTNSSVTLSNGNNITVTGSPLSLGGTASFDLTGTTEHAIQLGNATGSLTSATALTDGQLLIGSTGLAPVAANISSTGGTVTITNGAGTINLEAASGSGLPAGGVTGETLMAVTANDPVWTGSPSFSGTATAGTGLTATTGNVTVTAGNVLLPATNAAATEGAITIGTINALNMRGTQNIFMGAASGSGASFSGSRCLGIGDNTLKELNTGNQDCVALGNNAMQAATSARNFVAVGSSAGYNATSGGGYSVLIGASAANSATTGGNKSVAIGYQSQVGATGDNNISIGYRGGSQFSAAESSNIMIGNNGTAGDNNKMRLGTDGTGDGQVNATYIAGIYGVTPAGTKNMAIVDSNGQLGSQALPTGLTWAAVTADATLVINTGTVANKAGLLTMTLPATAAIGDILEFTNINTAVGLRIAQNAGQYIRIGSSLSTTGIAGYVETTQLGDSLKLVCTVAGVSTVWTAVSSMGNWTIA